jgi:hypothetical protein
LTESVDFPETLKKFHPKKTPLQFQSDWRVPLLLNLWVKPSPLFVGQENEEGEKEEVDFNWHC